VSRLPSFNDLFPQSPDKQRKIVSANAASRYFTPTNKNKILAYLSEGASITYAFAMTRIGDGTKQGWIERGKLELVDFDKGKTEHLMDYGQFLLNMQAAMASHAHKMRKQTEYLVFQEKDARYAALLVRLLAAENPDYYAPKQRVEQKTDIVVRYEFDELDGDAWEQRLLGGSANTDDSDTVEGEFVADNTD
jgi:hypothetical protein